MSAVRTPPTTDTGTESSSSPGATPRRDAEQTKAAILRAARHLLARHSQADITLKAVAERAGVSPPLILKYFGNKDALFTRVMSFDQDAEALLDAPSTASAATWSVCSSPASPSAASTPSCGSSSPPPRRPRRHHARQLPHPGE